MRAHAAKRNAFFFDYHDLGVAGAGRSRIAARRRKLVKKGKAQPQLKATPDFKRAKKYLDARLAVIDLGAPTYTDYEALIMSAANSDTKIIGEITPANGLLSEDRLRNIAGLENKPLFIFVMRDPVDRTWSGIRMVAKRKSDDNTFEKRARADLTKFLESDSGATHMRSDYATMLTKVDAAIPADRVFIDFFEEFLNQPKIDALCDFFGVDHHPAKLDAPRLSGKSLKLTDQERARPQRQVAPDL